MTDEKSMEKLLFSIDKIIHCTRGSYYLDTEYGSFCKSDYNLRVLLCAIRQALSELDGVYVVSIKNENSSTNIHILINDEERVVKF